MTDRIGQQLGNYRLARLLGQGSFAEVYLGEHIYLNTLAAIKVLQTRLTKEDVEKFRTEARIIASLLHPHIVRVLDFDVEEGQPFLVMDYAPNGTLRQRHPAGLPFKPGAIAPYVRQVAEALLYAHQQRLVHRDIKPENMLLGAANEALLSDFGIAIVAQSAQYKGPNDIAGTVAYMAPEQIQGQPCPASDQYALAIVVYEWLTGSRPFQGSYHEVVAQHAIAAPQRLRARVPGIPAGVEEVVLTALAKDPQKRFADVQAFATALQRASAYKPRITPKLPSIFDTPTLVSAPNPTRPHTPPAGMPRPETWPEPAESNAATIAETPAPPVSAPPQPQPTPVIPRRSVLIGASAVSLAAACGSLAWLVSTRTSIQPVQPTPTSTTPPQPATRYTYRGHSNAVYAAAWSPDGTRIASASFDMTVQVWEAATGAHVLRYTEHTAEVETVAWSPDGSYLASGGKDTTVQVWEAATGSRLSTYRGHSNHVLGVAWSQDGQWIASASLDGTVQVWSAFNGTGRTVRVVLPVWHGHTGGVYCVAWSPDGQSIVSGGADATAQVWNPFTGESRTPSPRRTNVITSVAWSPDGQRIVSASLDGTARVWGALDGSHEHVYRGHSGTVNSVAWSPDGQRVVSGGLDKSAQVWDADTSRPVNVYKGHTGSVESVAWSPHGMYIASASDDQTVRVWLAP